MTHADQPLSAPDVFQPEFECLPTDGLRDLQLQRLRDLLALQWAQVPPMRARLEQAGLHPDDLRRLPDLAAFPFTRKADLRDYYPLGLVAAPRAALRRIHASSGTSGKPTVVAYDQHDLDVFAEVVARSLHAAGARPGMTFHNAYGYGLFTGDWARTPGPSGWVCARSRCPAAARNGNWT